MLFSPFCQSGAGRGEAGSLLQLVDELNICGALWGCRRGLALGLGPGGTGPPTWGSALEPPGASEPRIEPSRAKVGLGAGGQSLAKTVSQDLGLIFCLASG